MTALAPVVVKVDAEDALRAVDGVADLVAVAAQIARAHADCRTDQCCCMGYGNRLASALGKILGKAP